MRLRLRRAATDPQPDLLFRRVNAMNQLNDLYLGIFSRAEQRVLQAIFRAIADGGGQCAATLAMLARDFEHQPGNDTQRDNPSGRNRPSGKDGTPLLLRCLASQHSDLREALMVPHNVAVGVYARGSIVQFSGLTGALCPSWLGLSDREHVREYAKRHLRRLQSLVFVVCACGCAGVRGGRGA
jgi:hypothetical protein